MRQEDRLRTLKMRISRHDDVDVILRRCDEPALERAYPVHHGMDGPPEPEPDVERNLVIAAARSVEFSSRGADFLNQPLLDRHMNILRREAAVAPHSEGKFPG